MTTMSGPFPSASSVGWDPRNLSPHGDDAHACESEARSCGPELPGQRLVSFTDRGQAAMVAMLESAA